MKTLIMQIDDSVYSKIKYAADEQKKDIAKFIEFIAIQYLSSSHKEFNATKTYFQECLQDMQNNETTQVAQQEYEQEMSVFVDALKSKYANS